MARYLIHDWLAQCPERDRPAALAALGVLGGGHRSDGAISRKGNWRLHLNRRLRSREQITWGLNSSWLKDDLFIPAELAAWQWRKEVEHSVFRPTLVIMLGAWDQAGLEPLVLTRILADPSVGLGAPLIHAWSDDPPPLISRRDRLRAIRTNLIVIDGKDVSDPVLLRLRISGASHVIIAGEPDAVFDRLIALPGHAPLVSVIAASLDTIREMLPLIGSEMGPHRRVEEICRQIGAPPPIQLASSAYLDLSEIWRDSPSISDDTSPPQMLYQFVLGHGETEPPKGRKRLAARRPTPEALPHRWLNGEMRDHRNKRFPANTCFQRGFTHTLEVWIGLTPPVGQKDAPAFPDDKLPPDQEFHDIRVILTEPRELEAPIESSLCLPRIGASQRVRLELPRLKGDYFEGRVLVCLGNRVLQTAKLTGAIMSRVVVRGDGFIHCGPEDAIRFEIEAVLETNFRELSSRPRFDASFVVNESYDATHQITAISDGGTTILTCEGEIRNTLGIIRSRLDELVEDSLTDQPMDGLWSLLAHQGDGLFRDVVLDRAHDLVHAERVQIIAAHSDAFLPLEFVYDADIVPRPGIGLCPDAARALDQGKCPHCSDEMLENGVCPIRFWGLSKIIERHVFDSSRVPLGADYSVAIHPPAGRRRFGPVDSALLGAYDWIGAADINGEVVDNSLRTATEAAHDNLERAMTEHAPRACQVVGTWDAWKTAVARDRPQVLILLSHTRENATVGTMELEIGINEALALACIGPEYVGQAPLVLLLGCATTDPTNWGHKFHAQFRRRGAAIVVGTLAKSYGPRAADAAREFLRLLRDPNRPPTLGEMMLVIRKCLLRQNSLMALTLIAYGDADWIMREDVQ